MTKTIRMPTGTVTFLFTDIEGSTRMWEQHPRAMQAALARHDTILREAVESNGGYVFKTVGDAFYSAFPTAPQALDAAIASQLAVQSADWPASGVDPIKVRMALHTGAAEVRDDYFGLPLNRVARLLSAGYGGQILLSLPAQQLVRDLLPPDTRLVDLGECDLKDLTHPEHIYQLAVSSLPTDFPPLKLVAAHSASGDGAAASIGQTQSAQVIQAVSKPGGETELRNPYKGLRAFQEADAPDFFGRETLTEGLLARMAEEGPLNRFLAVVGPSGSGKSSAVRAGLVPALRRGALPGAERWLIVEMLPGTHPLEEVDALLCSIAANPPATLMEMLQADERGLVRAVKRILPRDESIELVLVIDQFEEVFTLVEEEPLRVRFLENLHAAVTDPRSRLRVVVTLRADFFDRPLLYPNPGELMRQRTAVVLPLSAEELERAIVRPAQGVGVKVEEELVAATIKDVGEQPGALPLLQYALTELFERRTDHTMTLGAYRQSGGVVGALGRRAEELYKGLSEQEEEVAKQLFLRLVTLGEGVEDTRRRVRMQELASLTSIEVGEAEAEAPTTHPSPSKPALDIPHSAFRIPHSLDRVLDVFGRYRLLTFDRDPITKGPTVEVAHEALIRTWGRLREWLEQSRADLRVQRQLMAAAGEWAGAGRDRSFLAAGARLAQLEALAEGADKSGGVALTREEREYLTASVEERDRQEAEERERQAKELQLQKRAAGRLRALVVGMGVFLVVAVILTAFAFNREAEASTQRQRAEFNARQSQENASVAQANENRAQSSAATAVVNYTRAEAQRLAGEANTLLNQEGQRPELIALLSLRSINTQYSPQGDAALAGSMDLVYPYRVLAGHTDNVVAMVVAPGRKFWSDKYVLTGSSDNTARLWDALEGKEVQRFVGHTDVVRAVDLSPDGKYVLTGSDDKTARLWDVQTGKEIRRFTDHTGQVRGVAFSPDGRYVLTGGYDKTARLWDAATGQEVRRFTVSAERVTDVFFLPDGKRIVTDDSNLTLRIWDLSAGEELRQFRHMGYAGTSDGNFKYLLTQLEVGGQLWDVEANEVLFTVPEEYYSAVVLPDGKVVLTGSSTAIVTMWDTQTGAKVRQFTGLKSKVRGIALSADGKTVAAGDESGQAILWDAQTGVELRRFAGHIGPIDVVFSSDGQHLLTKSWENILRVWETGSPPALPDFVGHTGGIQTAIFSPDGRLIVTASNDGTARLWNAQTGEEVRSFTGHTDVVNWAAFSPDGESVFTAGFDRTARLWDVQTGKELRRFDTPEGVYSVAVSRDGRYGMVSPGHRPVQVFDLQTSAQVYTLTTSTSRAAYGMDFSPDGKYMLTGHDDEIARLWDMQTGKEVRQFTGHGNIIYGAVFSPDGKHILTGSLDKTVRLWDVQTGKEVRRFLGHAADVWGVAFSHDGKYAVSGSADRTARMWEVSTGREVRRFTGHTSDVVWAEFSPDDKLVLTGSNDNTARLWYADYHDTISYLCGKLLRDFTDEERVQYEIKDNEPTCRN